MKEASIMKMDWKALGYWPIYREGKLSWEAQKTMSEKAGTVTYVCPNCGKVNTIKYNDKLVCDSCIYGGKK